jgi:pyruvate/2-oxoglutarate/acetoin dehydrogenase E1 component
MVSTYVAAGVVCAVARLQAAQSIDVKVIDLRTLEQAMCQ